MKRIFNATFAEKLASKYDKESGSEMKHRCILCEHIDQRADSFPELVKKLKDYYGYPKPEDNYVFLPDGCESTYFSFSQFEDGESNVLDSIDDFDGQIYLCDYTFTFLVVIEQDGPPLTEADLVGLTLG